MALIVVEDGSQVTDANSYVSRETYIEYAATKGVTITDDETADHQLVQAAEFIDTRESSLVGQRVDRDQPMAFPRELYDGGKITVDGFEWEDDEIPRQVTLAQMNLALLISEGEDLYNPSLSTPVVSVSVEGVVQRQYAQPTTVHPTKLENPADTLLQSLFASRGSFGMPLKRA